MAFLHRDDVWLFVTLVIVGGGAGLLYAHLHG